MENIKEKILQFIQQKGPILPVEISKHINSNILIASAHLSELSSNGNVKISRVKVGGSPLYYRPGQEVQLQRFSDNLHEKEKKAYDLLLQRKVLRDNEIEPVVRVALRAIKDYAVPLQVNFKGNSEIFWRWYLLSNKDAEEMIKGLISEKKEEPAKPLENPAGEESEKEEKAKTEPEIVKEPEKEEPKKSEPKLAKVGIKKKKPAEKIEKNIFMDRITNHLSKNNIAILSKEILRKTEIDFLLQVPSAVGTLEYYAKAKNKKKINDSDLASVFAQGHLRKMPVLLITNGELTKRAAEMLQKDFKGMGIIKL
jgi:hypothetical protein